MNRRGFIGALVGGVAVAAAARTWPFRVYSFPRQIQPPLDLGFNVFDYAGIPIIEDTGAAPGFVYLLNEKYIAHPSTVKSWINLGLPKLSCRIKGLSV